ncbi:MAG: alanine racemase [Balneolales bacterium]
MTRYPFSLSHLEIHRDILRANAQYLHHNLGESVKSIAVIKSDAYGHGAIEVARSLTDIYDMFAVANVAEAVELREAGIRHPLLVFGVPVAAFAKAYTEFDLIAVISSEDHFRILDAGTSYHVEIDTGMGRLGIDFEMLDRLYKRIDGEKKITCEGIMTHFATADQENSGYMQYQKRLLNEICSKFKGKLPIHAANSAASLSHPDTHLDMVRHGIALYGYDPTPNPAGELQPVMKWKSRIVQCKRIREGASLSYGATWQAPSDGYYAVIPVGYGDGYRRNLSGKMPVFIEGNWYPQVGRVTMDYIMIWLGDRYFPAYTEVTVMGEEHNHAGRWADAIDTIPYEICCGIHPKVPRLTV